MHAIFTIPELLDHLLSFLANDQRTLRRLALTCHHLWQPCTLLLYADQSTPRAREAFRRLGALYLDYWEPAAKHAGAEEVYWRRLRVYAAFVRVVVGTLPPRSEKERGALPWPAYKGLETVLVQWPSDPPPSLPGASTGAGAEGAGGQEPLFCNLRKLKLGLESDAALRRLPPYLARTLRELELVLGEDITLPSLNKVLQTLPTHCPNLESFALETLVSSHRTIQLSLAELLPKLKELRTIRLRVAVGPELLLALQEVSPRALTLYLFDTNLPPSSASPTSAFPPALSLPRLDTLHLYGEPTSCTSLLLSLHSSPTLTPLRNLTLHLNGFSSPSTLQSLCTSISALSASSLQTIELRSLAARTQGGPARTIFPSSFSPLYACSRLENITFIGGWQGRDRILWRSQDLVEIAHAWGRVKVLNLVSQLWHGHRFDPLATLSDLLPLAIHCQALEKLSIALDLRHPPACLLPPSFRPPLDRNLKTLSLAAYSLPPLSEEAEVESSRFLRRLWPNVRVVVDPDSTNSPGELERWVEGVGLEGLWVGERGRMGAELGSES